MPVEVYGSNRAAVNVASGGTDAPAAGTQETWTVTSSAGFPAASSSASPPTQFHIADQAQPSEIIAVVNVSGTTWTVIRGAEGTTPVAHDADGFTVYAVVTTGGLEQARAVDWLNAVTMFGADPTGESDSTSAIQAALTAVPASGATVYLPAGTYSTSAALTIGSNTTLAGAGPESTVITQSSTTANGISGTDVSYVAIRDLGLSGPGSGSGNGISIAPSANPNVSCIDLCDVTVTSFGNTGVHLDTPIVSALRRVVAASNGGDGFQFSNTVDTPTSLVLDACYANTNAASGYEFDSAAYCALNGCASDHNDTGYAFYSCQGITLNGCGAESFTTAGWVFDGCTGCTLNGGRTYNGAGIVAHVTDGTVQQTITGLVETSPAAGATASIETDSGTSSVVINPAVVTAASYAAGTAYVIDGTGGAAH